MSALQALFAREFRLGFRSRGDVAAQLGFALLVTSLFPLALGPEAQALQKFAPGLLTLAVLFTQFLGFEGLYAADARNGTLDVLANSRTSFLGYALAKTFARWIMHALPLLLFSPLLALMLHLEPSKIPAAMTALALASFAITFVGSAAAALTESSRRGFLLPLLLMPLAVPVVIFCASLAENGFSDPAGRQAAFFLGALALLYLSICPPLTAAALRNQVEAA